MGLAVRLCGGKPVLLACPKANLAARITERENAGIVVEPDDVDDFLYHAISLLNQNALRRTMGTNTRRYAESAITKSSIVVSGHLIQHIICMKSIFVILLLVLVNGSVFAQTRVTARHWEAHARQLAIHATGNAPITAPSGIEPSPAPGDTVLVDLRTGTASGWRYEYVFGPTGERGQRTVIAVTLVDGSEPVVEPVYVRFPAGSDNYVPLPDNWIDSDAFIQIAKAFQVDEWSIDAMIASYQDAGAVTFRASGGSPTIMPRNAQWEIDVRSNECQVGISLQGTPDGSRIVSWSSPSERVGYCRSVEIEPEIDYAEFIPLAIGNEWHFESGSEQTRFVIWGDTLIDEVPFFVYERTTWSSGGAIRAVANCAVRTITFIDHENRNRVDAEVKPLGGAAYWDCQYGYTFPGTALPLFRIEAGRMISINGLNYFVPSTMVATMVGFGPGGIVYRSKSENALGIGPFSGLRYAKVGGKEYGVGSVSTANESVVPVNRVATAFPNPFTSEVYLTLEEQTGQDHYLVVYDTIGRMVRNFDRAAQGNTTRVRLELADLPSGPYFIQILDNGRVTATLPVVKIGM